MSKPRALVVGGSVGGLFAANLLRSTGWDVTVFERFVGSLADRGAGIGTRDELFSVMRRLGIKLDEGMTVDVRGRIALDRDGQVLRQTSVRSITSAWARIWQPLRDALPNECYRDGMRLTGITQDDGSVTARFADGTTETGDLLVGADGPLSTVRTQILPDLAPTPAPYVAWRGVVERDRLSMPQHAPMLDQMVFGFPPGELMLSIPMPAPQDDSAGSRCHFIWFRPLGHSSISDLCTDTAEPWDGAWVMENNIRRDALAALKAEGRDRLPPQMALLLEAATQIILQPIFDLQSPRMVFGRVVLLGDAAFIARPHVATGVMKAALDAERLADALAGTTDDLNVTLAGYDHERRMFGDWLVTRGRHIAGYFEPDESGSEPARIEALLREYGAAGVVADEPITVRQLG